MFKRELPRCRHEVLIWENLLDLSRSLNFLSDHFILNYIKLEFFINTKLKNLIKILILITVYKIVLTAIFSIISTSLLSKVSWILGLLIVLMIVIVGIIFDMLGIAATAASEAPFNAMAAEKVVGAKEAVLITKNADRFASFCNDVIGDI